MKVWYTVDRVPTEYGDVAWPYDIGLINEGERLLLVVVVVVVVVVKQELDRQNGILDYI